MNFSLRKSDLLKKWKKQKMNQNPDRSSIKVLGDISLWVIAKVTLRVCIIYNNDKKQSLTNFNKIENFIIDDPQKRPLTDISPEASSQSTVKQEEQSQKEIWKMDRNPKATESNIAQLNLHSS